MSPGFLLAALVIAIATQAVRVVIPPRGPYALTLALSMLGLAGGEVLAGSGHLTRPSLGVLHPAADLLVMAVTQAAGSLVMGSRIR